MHLTGIVLAAGAGLRAGGPKVLRPGWLDHAVDTLAGCDSVLVVLGAAVVPVPSPAIAVVAEDWETGMSASLRAGIAAASGDAALVTLVDLPGMPLTVARRVAASASRSALAHAVYGGRPGHPVLIGADHWIDLAASLRGDRGARSYLDAHGATRVECGDLWNGEDVDEPAPGGAA
jgi:CTP:molybdopterin cytidylyltransferase MocA